MAPLLIAALASADNIVVDAEGGGDFTDLGDAIAAVVDGATIEVVAGEYSLADVQFHGSYLTIEGEGSDLVTVRDGGAANYFLALQVGAGDANISGVTFDGASDGGATLAAAVWIDAGGLVTLEDVVFRDFAGGGFFLPWDSTSSTLIDGCTFENNGIGIRYDDVWDVEIRNSQFLGNMSAINAFVYVGGDSLALYNNVFAANEWALWDDDSGVELYTAHDNIFIDNDYPICFNAPEYANVDFDNNLYASLENPDSEYCLLGENPIEADPGFVAWSNDGDFTNDDFHLLPGSAAIDLGIHSANTTDLEGTTRPLDGNGDGERTNDLGAYEYGPDLDADGSTDLAAGGDDCDDTRADVYPGAVDECADGTDQDCSGADADAPCDTGDTGTGDTADSGTGDSGEDTAPGDSSPGDSEPTGDDTDTGADKPPADPDCGCNAGGGGAWLGLLGLLALRRR